MYGIDDFEYPDADAGYVDEDEEEMPTAERELADDAQWKIIQKNTFTRWANEHLKQKNSSLEDLQFDLSDGLRLVSLVEALSGNTFRHVNKRPSFRTQKLENVTMTLRFLEDVEGLRLVNIDSTDIVDGKLKLILGLIWTLILHYSITMPLWEGEEELPPDERGKGPSPKQRLLGWLNSKMPDKPVKNFTTDWNDGTALGALVDACAPGLCPDWKDWEPRQAMKNAQEAIDAAEQWLEVPQLIRPEEMTNPRVDEKAMMTYLSQFPSAKLRDGAPLRPKLNPARVRAYGPGLEPEGNTVGAPARFTIDTFSAGRGSVEVIVLNPKGQKEPCEIINNNDRNQTFSCAYVPSQEGEYRVIVKFAGKEITNSPFKVMIEGAAGDPTKVSASGPGLEPTGNQVGRRTFFNIFTTGAAAGNVDSVILDPHGRRNAVKPRITRQAEDNYLVEYTPKEEGLHSVNVFFAGQQIPHSPFGVMVGPIADAKQAYATGRGVQPRGLRVRDHADFKVHTEDAGEADLEVAVIGPGNSHEPCHTRKSGPHLYDCSYTPQRPGPYVVNVKYGGDHILMSPFNVDVGPYKESKIRAFGPGLSGGIVNKPALFVVETNGETGALGFSIEGPSEAKIDCTDNGDGSANVVYWPTAPGEYAVHIMCNDENIPKSPYMAQIQPDQGQCDPERAKAYGPGLEPGVQQGKPADFTVDIRDAGGPAPVKAECYDAEGEPVPVQVRDKGDGTFACQYTPKKPKKHTILASYGGVNVPRSPFKVDVMEPSQPQKVRVYGPGVESATRGTPTYFIVDCKEAGPGDIGISVTDETGRDVPVETKDKGDGTFSIQYTALTHGPQYTVQVFFADVEVPRSPFRVPIQANVDLSKVRVENLPASIPVGIPHEFDVITSGIPGKPKPAVAVRAPNGARVPSTMAETVDGYAVGFTPTMQGQHTVSVDAAGRPVPGSPFRIDATASVEDSAFHPRQNTMERSAAPSHMAGLIEDEMPFRKQAAQQRFQEPTWPPAGGNPDAARVRAYGDGLKHGIAGHSARFTIDSRDAPPAPLGVTIEGPAEARIDYVDNGDGTCAVEYLPVEPGSYKINVLYKDGHIANSPFTAQVVPQGREGLDVSRVRAYGQGIQPTGVFKESFSKFTVDARPIDPVGRGVVKAIVTNPNRQRTACLVDNNKDGTYKCSYSPVEDGPHQIEVTYDGFPIPGSPFPVQVVPGCDPTRVRAYGPGLESGLSNEPQKFKVDLDGAGQGGLGLAVEGPADAHIKCQDNKDGTCSVEYLPTRPGTYDVFVKFNDIDIPGSPFHVPIRDQVDASKVVCYGPGLEPRGARAKQPATFTVDTSRAGEAPLQVTTTDAHGRPHPAQVLPRGPAQPGMYDVTYTPESEGPCQVDVRYGGQEVPRFPLVQHVLSSCEPHKVLVEGEGVKPTRGSIPASLPTSFNVDTREAGVGELELALVDPEGHPLPLEVANRGDGTFTCRYRPEQVGRHTVRVKFAGRELPESPYMVHATPSGRPDLCKIQDGVRERVPVGQEVATTVNTSQAGPGQISCRITTPTGTQADVHIDDNGSGLVRVRYTPQQRGDYSIEIRFGGEVIPNGRYTQKAVSPDELANGFITETQDRLYSRQTQATYSSTVTTGYHPIDFKLPVGPVFSYVDAVVRTPSGRTARPLINDNRDGTVTIQYQPTEHGMHELEVTYNGQPVPGSPFRFYVESVGTGRVTAYGPGLSHGRAGEQADFSIVTKDAGAGGLALAVEGPSKAEIQCHDNKNGTCGVTYLPVAPGDYNISIKFMDQHIPGSPFTAKISGEARKRAQVCVGTTSDVPLKISETDIHNLTASVRSPSGREEPSLLKRMPNGHLGISFTPREIGEHLVNVFRSGRHIPNSPFKIFVGENEIGNAGRVRVYGDGLREGMANELCQFTVDTRNAGYGGLSLSIEGPSKVEIECHDNHDGTCLVTYRPNEPGTYIINIKYADENVPGSPFAVRIGGEPSARLMERITRRREAADVTHIGSQCELSLKIPGTNPRDMTATVTSPSGALQRCDILDMNDSHYSIKFVPREMGVHTVSVKHRDMHIPGSPFQFTVGPITEGGAHKVHASGSGLQQGFAEVPCEFNIYTREAGAGGLSIAIEGPSKAEIDFEDRKDGSCGVTYRVAEPGEYLASIKFNDEHIPGSPFRVSISESTDGYADRIIYNDSKQLSVAAVQDRGLQIGRPAAFTVNYSGVTGRVRAYVSTPSGEEEEAVVHSVDRDQYAVRFVPRMNGPHLVHVLIEDRPIPGSPFRVLVGQEDSDPGLVYASGDGLTRGKVGDRNRFFVNTVNAGSGALSATVDGPSKVQLNCQEREDGYEFTYIPTSPGEYLITIKYGGNFNIMGSPFRAHVTGETMPEFETFQQQSHLTVESSRARSTGPQRSHPESYPERVHCQGTGLKRAYIGQSNTFNVDAGTAGMDVLYVGVSGPVRPCEEVNIKHMGRNQFSISYTVKEPGRHLLMVKWGDRHIPGSPFVVEVP